MSAFSAAVLYLGVALQVCLVARLLQNRLWRHYPWFAACVIWSLVRTLLFFVTPPSLYSTVYWTTDIVDVFIRFFVVWEIVRHLFPSGPSLIVLFSRGFSIVVVALLAVSVSSLWSYQAYVNSHSMRAAMERSASFTQAVMTLGLLLVARFYDISLSRQLRTIAIAFGAWASIAMANNAMIDLEHSFLPYWQVVRPLSFVALLGIWAWALWVETPEVRRAKYPVTASELGAWSDNWSQTQASLRRIKPL